MTSSQRPAGAAPTEYAPVERALGQSNDMKAKVKACVEEVSAASAVVQKNIADGASTLSAPKTLAEGKNLGRIATPIERVQRQRSTQ